MIKYFGARGVFFALCTIITFLVLLACLYSHKNTPKRRKLLSVGHSRRDYIDNVLHDGFAIHEFDHHTEDMGPELPTDLGSVKIYLGNPGRLKQLHNECIPLNTWGGITPICIYDPEKDRMISAFIKDTHTWEQGYLNATSQLLLQHPELTFVDLGCNIGAFTITAAKLGRRVYAVDIMEDSLLLLKHSLDLGKIHENVTLIHNALSDTRSTFEVNVVVNNVGGSYIKDVDKTKSGTKHPKVKSILLDDLLSLNISKDVFVKIDIEETELKAFMGGKRFFSELNVRYLLMEWMLHRAKPSAIAIMDFLLRHGMLPYRDHQKNYPLRYQAYRYWPDNVFWIKR